MIRHSRRVVLRLDILLFTKKCFINETGRFQEHVLKFSKSVCTSTVMVSPDPLSSNPSTSSAVKTTENMEEDPDDPEPADRDTQIKYSDQLYSSSIGQQQNITCKNVGQYWYCQIIWNIW
jgi:hypothetical protein